MTLRPGARALALFILSAGFTGLTAPARANERHFAFTYESAVLPAGQKELEFWNTWRDGRKNFYSAIDNRLEYEVGLGHRLQTSLYVNWQRVSEADPANPANTVTSSDVQGISSEWKWKFADPVADAVGGALYEELTFASDEAEAETKLILDKRLGSNLLAFNAVLEPDWDFSAAGRDFGWNFETDWAATHFFTPGFSSGLEASTPGRRTSEGTEYIGAFLGPVVSYATDGWWVTATWLQQLPAIRREDDDRSSGLILDPLEKANFRVLVSVRLP